MEVDQVGQLHPLEVHPTIDGEVGCLGAPDVGEVGGCRAAAREMNESGARGDDAQSGGDPARDYGFS